jgi:cobalt/nickel transport protein
MKKVITLLFILCASVSFAHFQTLIPSTDVVTPTSRTASFHMEFTHPFEQGPVMEMVKPKDVSVFFGGKKTDLMKSISKTAVEGKTAWDFKYSFTKPGDYIFAVTPDYYFEPAEGVFIQHITKTVVNAFGMEEGWDTPAGLKAEIVPLTRPYGLWTGNTFTGQVLYKGKPVADAEIEVEFYNKGSKIKHPTDAHITQVIKADSNGIFSYSMPFTGWWAFAALIEDDVTVKHEGKDYPVELGAVFWVKTYGAK